MKLLPQANFSTEQMNEELEYILEKLNTEIDLRQLKYFFLSLQDLGEETVKMEERFTNQHEEHFGKYKEEQIIGSGYEQHGIYVSSIQIEKARFNYESPEQTDKGRKILEGELCAIVDVNNLRITKEETK